MPAHFCLVCVKIVLVNPHTYLVKTGSELSDSKYNLKKYTNFYEKNCALICNKIVALL